MAQRERERGFELHPEIGQAGTPQVDCEDAFDAAAGLPPSPETMRWLTASPGWKAVSWRM